MTKPQTTTTTPKPDDAARRAGAWLTIDLGALAGNYRLIDEKTGKACETAAVVKADGYGLGAVPVARALYAAGCRMFFVVTPDEALTLRAALNDDTKIAVLGGLYGGAEDIYAAHNLMPVLNTLDQIFRWKNFSGAKPPALIHFDTGMNRVGLDAKDAAYLCDRMDLLDGIGVFAIISHFVSAEEHGNPITMQQYESFKKIAAHFPQARKSLANSAGVFCNDAFHFDMVRPGMALYGLNPTPDAPNPMRPVVSLNARILQVRPVKKGDTVGYNQTYTFDKDTYSAAIAVGYADGFLRSISHKGLVYIDGVACPLRGKVSMDIINAEVGHLKNLPREGDIVEILGPHQDAQTLGDAAGTIDYEILTSLGPRYHRTYKSGQ